MFLLSFRVLGFLNAHKRIRLTLTMRGLIVLLQSKGILCLYCGILFYFFFKYVIFFSFVILLSRVCLLNVVFPLKIRGKKVFNNGIRLC